MNSPADFHRLESRLRLCGRIVTRTGLHIGAADTSGHFVDMPVLVDGRGMPFIPGASLKGVLRATIESLIQAVEDQSAGIWACDSLHEKKSCGSHPEGRRSEVDLTKHCMVCRLLGSRVLASHVRISDALLREHPGISPVERRDGVAIDRDLGRVAGNKKYDFEVVAPGVSFDLELFVDNPKPWLLGLMMLGWDQISEGFTAIGGFSSRGLGRVELHWEAGERHTAKSLLAGEAPTRWDADALANEQQTWRSALAERLEGGERVQG